MTRATTIRISAGTMFAGMLCAAPARAQVVREPLAPIQCFEIADAEGLTSSSALQLCAGAISPAPGQCFAIADDEHELSTTQVLDLCSNATSTAPIACFAELEADATLTNEQMIDYCATSCPLGPAPPEASNATCLAAALELTTLTDLAANRLCARSQSTAPVECFAAGEDTGVLTNDQLVDLCAETRSCQYINAVANAP